MCNKERKHTSALYSFVATKHTFVNVTQPTEMTSYQQCHYRNLNR